MCICFAHMGKSKNKNIAPQTETADEKSNLKKGKRKSTTENDTEETPAKKSHHEPSETITAGTTIEKAASLAVPTSSAKRAKRREKHAKNQQDKQEQSKNREKQDVCQYLQTWNDNREKWKFQKLKQIYIQEHVFDEDLLDDTIWPIVLEYISGTKGSGKETLSNRAKTIIKDVDRQAKDSGDKSLLEGSKYRRARDVLQYLG
ncbi:uncharacterized protein C7orf50 homolog [Sabethes cyaneus]|uniref:uncharacterized protein C7orf50 homolog n=1 Tax=Sabethes cyaneus TaxID=53552 RepID=UPI00237D6083|nr:uncharacterized protein C7orf50 homolog [Sabethes cyaneus]